MPRRAKVIRREIPPDPKYQSVMVQRLINKTMQRGKKSLAERIVYRAFDMVERQTRRPALDVLEQALRNVTPVLEVRPRRVGGATYQIPIEIRGERRTSLALRWLLQAARGRRGRPMVESLAAEITDAAQGQGGAAKKRDDTHRMAEANKAFVHYRW